MELCQKYAHTDIKKFSISVNDIWTPVKNLIFFSETGYFDF
jgi:hypothetical protein